MNWVNYDDVVGQLRSVGLVLDGELNVGSRRPVRCRVEGRDREKRGWYRLREYQLTGGDTALVGSFGVWTGASQNAQRVELRIAGERRKLTDEERAAFKARMEADRRAAEQQLRLEHARAAAKATAAWKRCTPDGDSDYLRRKQVGAHGVRYSPQGALVIPMLDTAGRIHGLQVIHAKKKRGRDKDFWPTGLAKQGHFFQMGDVPRVGGIVLLGEGYATVASAFAATGYPGFVAFDAGNLIHVAKAIARRWRGSRILVLADDDHVGRCIACDRITPVATDRCAHCGELHGKVNTGLQTAPAIALAVDGKWLAPTFATDRPTDAKGPTDWNDLHCLEGIHAVRAQIDGAVRRWGWIQPDASRAHAHHQGGGENATTRTIHGDNGGVPHANGHAINGHPGAPEADPVTGIVLRAPLRPVEDEEALHQRFALVYEMPDAAFDGDEHILVPIASVKNICSARATFRRWMESPSKRIVRKTEVDFDPSEQRRDILCNLWGGWPTVPREGDCEALLDLLAMLCGCNEDGAGKPQRDTYQWVLKWLAYPIQHPGAKMKTALVFHGPQGTGKNLFFEDAVKKIYGRYGGLVDQAAIEDKFNDYASRKLFLVADEVVARQELYHVANRLKSFVTGEVIRINPKNHGAYEETNHVQVVFLSNNVQPLVLDPDDRRYCVVWTPPKQDSTYYARVRVEISRGGIAALHHHLLHLPLGDFEAGTLPPMTEAKRDLIEISLDSTERFWNEWTRGRLGGFDDTGSPYGLPVRPCVRMEDLYDAYRHWCIRAGVAKSAQLSTFAGNTAKRPGAIKARERHAALDGTHEDRQSTLVWPRGRGAEETKDTRSSSVRLFASDVERYRDVRREGRAA